MAQSQKNIEIAPLYKAIIWRNLMFLFTLRQNNNTDDMNTMIINREASTYWEQVKDASQQVKLALISLLSASLVTP